MLSYTPRVVAVHIFPRNGQEVEVIDTHAKVERGSRINSGS